MNRPVKAVKRVLRRRKPAEPPALIRTPRPSLTYRLVSYLLVFPIYRLLFRGRTAGNGNVPMDGALVVVANHGSHLDPPLLGHALGRPVAFMAEAATAFATTLEGVSFADAAIPVLSNTDPTPETSGTALKERLRSQMTTGVRWRETMDAMTAAGISTAVEIGPGNVLSGLIKRSTEGISNAQVATAADLGL